MNTKWLRRAGWILVSAVLLGAAYLFGENAATDELSAYHAAGLLVDIHAVRETMHSLEQGNINRARAIQKGQLSILVAQIELAQKQGYIGSNVDPELEDAKEMIRK